MRFKNGWREFELVVIKAPGDEHDLKMIEELAARIVKELCTVDDSVIIEIREHNGKEGKDAWIASIADVDEETNKLMLSPLEGLEIWISESRQFYEATCFSKESDSYNGFVDINVSMYADEKDHDADDNAVAFQENAYAKQVLHTAHMCYRETITDLYKDWATQYINSPNYIEAHKIE